MGKHLRQATIYIIKTGADPLEYIVIKMENVSVASVMAGGKQDYGLTTETVSLKFGRVTFSYTPQKPDGSPDATVEFRWDLVKNR
jgi:type VI secretion system secreted protein Hcp